ncbi:CatB-related O-acetyltransferase [Anaerofilum sp. BX8]|uniref:CatB-related O-acetyltransferase n=1 Tax=Anaerofilum hominis TaxID=2763016 RepID=A0A923KXT5_9FIRM|nr:CatB-related O-acetyltransferase [Anaerofilum hominis]
MFPNEYKTSCFLKNVVKAPNIVIGDYTYYDDDKKPTDFERNNILFNYPEFGDRLIIGKFCAIASGTKFIMGPANHRTGSVTTYPFHVFGGAWEERTPAHLSQLPFKGDIVIGNDVWIGRESVILPGVHIGDGSVIGAYSVVTRDVPPYSVAGGNPAQLIKKRFNEDLIRTLLQLKWWDFEPEKLLDFLPLLCDLDLDKAEQRLRQELLRPAAR